MMKSEPVMNAIRNQCLSPVLIRRVFCCLLLACCAVVTGGCGYSVYGKANLPFKAISIGKIVNKTYETRLEDKLRSALADELLKNGFTLEKNADHRIEGVINYFEMRIVSEKAGVAVQYQVIIRGSFKLTDPSGKIKPLRGEGLFLVSFFSAESLEGVIAQKEKAIDRALNDLVVEMVASMIYL